MGKLSRILEKSGYSVDLSSFVEPEEVEFPAVEDSVASTNSQTETQAPAVCHKEQPSSCCNRANGEDYPEVFCRSKELSEAFRLLCSKIFEPANKNTVPRSLMITSVVPGEGRSVVAANIGISLAQHIDQSLILVDCDLRLSSLAKLLGVPSEAGVSDYLSYEGELPGLVQETQVGKVRILAAGTPPENSSELLGSVRIHDLVEELACCYPESCFIFDTPSMEAVPESYVLSQAVDGVVLVVQPERSDQAMIQRVISDIGAHKILGIISNGSGVGSCQPQSSFSFQEV
jgi:capsular exopolysaccharide synthesis family protein